MGSWKGVLEVIDLVIALRAEVDGTKTLGPPSLERVLAVNVIELVCIAALPGKLRRRGIAGS